eukprot:sb/3471880/
MMALEKKFRVPLLCAGGMGASRFRGKTVKNLTLSLLKSVRPYDDSNPDWVDLKSEFRQLDEYLVQCHNKEGDYLKEKRFTLWDIRMVPALYNLVCSGSFLNCFLLIATVLNRYEVDTFPKFSRYKTYFPLCQQMSVANLFKPGFEIPDDVPHLRSYMNHAFEDPIFLKFKPTIRQV